MSQLQEDHFGACVDLIGRTGAKNFLIRFDEPDEPDEGPTVWIAMACYERVSPLKHKTKTTVWEVGAGMTPPTAAMRLCDQLIDGGQCTHCHRPTGVSENWETRMPADSMICWYVYDPERKTFRRGCE